VARTRYIKPGFFSNDNLAELKPLARLLFAGLWCIADREGRLEDRPKRIKAEVLPFDICNIEALLNSLHDAGFIHRYESGASYIQISKFSRHQHPHVKEPPSTIPAPGSHDAGTSPEPVEPDINLNLEGKGEWGTLNGEGEPPSGPRANGGRLALAYMTAFAGRTNETIRADIEAWENELPPGELGDRVIEYAFAERERAGADWRYVMAIFTRLKNAGWPDDFETPRDIPDGLKVDGSWFEERYNRGKQVEA